MQKIKFLIFFYLVFGFIFSSCKKVDDPSETPGNIQNKSANVKELIPVCSDCDLLAQNYADSIEHLTLLGDPILNPYTIPNMTQAYFNVYGRNPIHPLLATHKYVKFLPTTKEQIDILSDEDIDLTEFPLDRKLISEGDYYVEPGADPTAIPALYAVVPINYVFPSGISYVILENMYIPDDVQAWEDEALYLTNNLDDDADIMPLAFRYQQDQTVQWVKQDESNITQYEVESSPNGQQFTSTAIIPARGNNHQPAKYSWSNANFNSTTTQFRIKAIDNNGHATYSQIVISYPVPCDPLDCGGGGGGGGGGTGGGGGGGTSDCAHHPSGKIMVQNELATDRNFRAVRNVRVVVRRTFKVYRGFTDNNGAFQSSKYFRNKYTILTKFKNEFARVARATLNWGSIPSLFPIKINFGKWKNLDCGHEFRISHPDITGLVSTSHWCAAVTHNAVIEHKEMCTQEKVGLPPYKLHILMDKDKSSNSAGTLMLHQLIKTGSIVPGILLIAYGGLGTPDIIYGYGGDSRFLKTDEYCELAYHELSHAGHYAQVGNNWWILFGIDEALNPSNGIGTYGPCCTNDARKISVGEGWAYHMGHYLANKKWGLQSTTFPEQGTDIKSWGPNVLMFSNSSTFSSHQNFLEQYNPNYNRDANRWIPKGLFNDMMDNGTEPYLLNGIIDNVHGFTNQQFYKALLPTIDNLTQYKNKFLQQNGYQQQAQINQLFQQYGY